MFLDFNSQKSWLAEVMVKVSGSCSPRTSGSPRLGTTALEDTSSSASRKDSAATLHGLCTWIGRDSLLFFVTGRKMSWDSSKAWSRILCSVSVLVCRCASAGLDPERELSFQIHSMSYTEANSTIRLMNTEIHVKTVRTMDRDRHKGWWLGCC